MIAQDFTLFEKMRATLSFIVFYSSEWKDDPCKSDRPKFYPFWKIAWHFTTVKVRALHFTYVDKMRDTLPFLVLISLERKNEPCKSDSPTFYRSKKCVTHTPYECLIHDDMSVTPRRTFILQQRCILNRVIHSYYETLLYQDIRKIMVMSILLRGTLAWSARYASRDPRFLIYSYVNI